MKSKAEKIIITAETLLVVMVFTTPILLFFELDLLLSIWFVSMSILAAIYFGTIFFDMATGHENFLNK